MNLSRMRVTEEMFAIPVRNHFLLYAPLKGALARVNRGALAWLSSVKSGMNDSPISASKAFIQQMQRLGILEFDRHPFPQENRSEGFLPTDLIVLTTTECNFRCVYCYASAGAKVSRVDAEVVEAAVRLIVENAKAQGKNECNTAFHGGGEPMLEWGFIQHIVTYARKLAGTEIRILPSVTTNGYLSDDQISWIGENMASVQVSLDGPAHIQNLQRPMASGSHTFHRVVHTVKQLERSALPDLIIKATVTNYSTPLMSEITRFMCENFRLRRFHFGPVMELGRSQETGFGHAEASEFVRQALEAQHIARGYGKRIVVSQAQETFPNLRLAFCGLTLPNFAVTVEGRITACYEVLYENDPRSSLFHYGHYDRERGEFVFDQDKVRMFRERTVPYLARCEGCFIRWQCAGDCQARWQDPIGDAERLDPDDFRCRINREMVKHEMLEMLAGADRDYLKVDSIVEDPLQPW